MNIRDGYNNKKGVTFDTQDRLDNKLDNTTLTAQGSYQNRPFKPKIYQGQRRGQTRNYYDQGKYQNRFRSNGEIGECHIEVELSMDIIIEEGCSMITIIEITLEEKILE